MATYKTLSTEYQTGPVTTETHLVCTQPHQHTSSCYASIQNAAKGRAHVVVEYGGQVRHHEFETTDPVEIEQAIADLALAAEAEAVVVKRPSITLPSLGKFVTAKVRPARGPIEGLPMIDVGGPLPVEVPVAPAEVPVVGTDTPPVVKVKISRKPRY